MLLVPLAWTFTVPAGVPGLNVPVIPIWVVLIGGGIDTTVETTVPMSPNVIPPNPAADKGGGGAIGGGAPGPPAARVGAFADPLAGVFPEPAGPSPAVAIVGSTGAPVVFPGLPACGDPGPFPAVVGPPELVEPPLSPALEFEVLAGARPPVLEGCGAAGFEFEAVTIVIARE